MGEEYLEDKNGLKIYIDGVEFRNNTAKPPTDGVTDPDHPIDLGKLIVVFLIAVFCVYMCEVRVTKRQW